jgi:NADPH-dependent glutamate synthase beta subunit-like oxidoreductase
VAGRQDGRGAGSEKEYKADLVLLAMGFVAPVATCSRPSASTRTRAATPRPRPNRPPGYKTNVDKVFAAGDMRRGQSLVVWAIREGRQAARAVDEFLMGAACCRAETIDTAPAQRHFAEHLPAPCPRRRP